MTEIRVTVTNTSGPGGTFLTPVWVGFHDGSFDLFDRGEAASPGLEALAEDGNFAPIAAELTEADEDAQGGAVLGDAGPIATGEVTAGIFDIDGEATPELSLGAMILPSNDAFVGTNAALELFDEDGEFLGAQLVTFTGENVYDAGTEVNTELDAAFINQMGPDTGVDEDGVVVLHPGFNGSLGNPEGEGDQIILGGTNAFGVEIDPVAADFTREGAQIATVHINTVARSTGTDGKDTILGDENDDIVNAGSGRDIVFGGDGWDILRGAQSNDILLGEGGADRVSGGRGSDLVSGGAGDDWLIGGRGTNDLVGGLGDDTFVLATGGSDTVHDFEDGDILAVRSDAFESVEDLIDAATDTDDGVSLDFGVDGSATLIGVTRDDLDTGDIVFV